MTMEDVNRLYKVNNIKIFFRHVSNDSLYQLVMRLNEFKEEIEINYERDEYLLSSLTLMKKFTHKIITRLKPYRDIMNEDLQQEVKMYLLQIKKSFPELFDSLGKDIAILFKDISEISYNPLYESIENLLKPIQKHMGLKIAIVSKGALSESDKSIVKNHESLSALNVVFLTYSGLRRSLELFDLIIYIGNPDYFGISAKTNFRGKETYFLSYDFFANGFEPHNILGSIAGNNTYSTIYNNVCLNESLNARKEITLFKDDSHEQVVNALIERVKVNNEASDRVVEVNVVMLENNRVIFIPPDASVRVYSESNKQVVDQKKFTSIEEDNFIVIRNERESRLIAEIADKDVLKEDAVFLRELQVRWKKRLRSAVRKQGVKTVSDILSRKYKMETSAPNSVRFWCSEDSICPKELDKLLPALKFSSNDAKEIFESMQIIRRAHIKAGNIISRRLVSELSNGVSVDLQENGFFTFNSNEFDGASFNIERIVFIDKKKKKIPASYVMKIMCVD